eukprot:6205647-Pleurochrysis_carterae.AAC.2
MLGAAMLGASMLGAGAAVAKPGASSASSIAARRAASSPSNFLRYAFEKTSMYCERRRTRASACRQGGTASQNAHAVKTCRQGVGAFDDTRP